MKSDQTAIILDSKSMKFLTHVEENDPTGLPFAQHDYFTSQAMYSQLLKYIVEGKTQYGGVLITTYDLHGTCNFIYDETGSNMPTIVMPDDIFEVANTYTEHLGLPSLYDYEGYGFNYSDESEKFKTSSPVSRIFQLKDMKNTFNPERFKSLMYRGWSELFLNNILMLNEEYKSFDNQAFIGMFRIKGKWMFGELDLRSQTLKLYRFIPLSKYYTLLNNNNIKSDVDAEGYYYPNEFNQLAVHDFTNEYLGKLGTTISPKDLYQKIPRGAVSMMQLPECPMTKWYEYMQNRGEREISDWFYNVLCRTEDVKQQEKFRYL